MLTVDLAYGLAALALFASLLWHACSERTGAFRHQVLELAAMAVRRSRPIADVLQAATVGRRRREAHALRVIADALDAGLPLSEALGELPHHFPAGLRHAIAAAEGDESLGAVLDATAAEADHALTAAHRRHLALAYPLVLSLALVACWEITAPMFAAAGRTLGAPGAVATDRSASLASSIVGTTRFGRLAPSALLAMVAIGYVWMLSVATRTRWGQRVLGRLRDLLDRAAGRVSPTRRRRDRARLLGVLAQAIGRNAPLHVALDLGGRCTDGALAERARAAAAMARAGAPVLDIWTRLGASPGAATRLAAARTSARLASTLHELADADAMSVRAAHERWLVRIPIVTVCVFGLLIADHFGALMHCLDAARAAAMARQGGSDW